MGVIPNPLWSISTVPFPVFFWVVFPPASNSFLMYVFIRQDSVEYLRGTVHISGVVLLCTSLLSNVPSWEQQRLDFSRFLALLLPVLQYVHFLQQVRLAFIGVSSFDFCPPWIPVGFFFCLFVAQWPMFSVPMFHIFCLLLLISHEIVNPVLVIPTWINV